MIIKTHKDIIFKYKKHKNAFEFALQSIKKSIIFPYIEEIILYGSCARNEENWESDIDLLIITQDIVEKDDKLRLASRFLQGNCSLSDVDDAKVDMHIINHNIWLNKNTTYLNEIRKDGIQICK